MVGILEGKEIEGKIAEIGGYSVDVSKDGMIELSLSIATKIAEGCIEVDTKNSIKIHLLKVIEIQCAKNNVVWDEALIAQIKMIIGMVG